MTGGDIRDELRTSVRLVLTSRQAERLRLLLLGEIGQPMIEDTHRRTWRQILAKIEAASEHD